MRMRKIMLLALAVGVVMTSGLRAGVGLPVETIRMPMQKGPLTLRLYSRAEDRYIQTLTGLSHEDVYDLTVPAWNQWYWVGIWREADNTLLKSAWISHVRTH